MVTPEELGQISVFACLDTADRERVCRAAADITLERGEFAAHEGDERALFAVLEGQIEATRMVDGIHRQIGNSQPGRSLRRGTGHARHRLPGQLPRRRGIAGDANRAETTITPSPPLTPSIAEEVGQLAANRIGGPGGLQGLAAAPEASSRDRSRPPLGRRLRGAAPLPRPQPDHPQVAAARRAGGKPSSGGPICRPRVTTPRSGSSTARQWCGPSSAVSRSCSRSRPSPRQRSTTP